MKTSILVPACTEEESPPDAINDLRRHTQAGIIIVDDGSQCRMKSRSGSAA